MTLFTNRNWIRLRQLMQKITNELFIPHLLTKELFLKRSGKKYCWKLHCREKGRRNVYILPTLSSKMTSLLQWLVHQTLHSNLFPRASFSKAKRSPGNEVDYIVTRSQSKVIKNQLTSFPRLLLSSKEI